MFTAEYGIFATVIPLISNFFEGYNETVWVITIA
jgi:hypothetical protein